MSANEPRCASCGEVIADPEQECKNFNGPMACKPVKHVVNGDPQNGWYCYECDFFTRDVIEAAEHDGRKEHPNGE